MAQQEIRFKKSPKAKALKFGPDSIRLTNKRLADPLQFGPDTIHFHPRAFNNPIHILGQDIPSLTVEKKLVVWPDSDILPAPPNWQPSYGGIPHYQHLTTWTPARYLQAVQEGEIDKFTAQNVGADFIEGTATKITLLVKTSWKLSAVLIGILVRLYAGGNIIHYKYFDTGQFIDGNVEYSDTQSGLSVNQADANDLEVEIYATGSGWVYFGGILQLAGLKVEWTYQGIP